MNGPDVPSSGTTPTGGDPGYDAVIEDLLAGRLGHEPEDEMSLVGLVDALRAPGSDEELGDVAAAASAFVSARTGVAAEAVVVPLASRRTGRAVVAVAAVLGGVVLLGGTAAAATGNLPPALQDVAHVILPFVPSAQQAEIARRVEQTAASSAAGDPSTGEPGAGSSSKGAGQTLLPLAPTDPARDGQCRAFFAGGLPTGSTSYRRLELAADKAGVTVAAWCATFAPGSSAAGKPTATPSGSGTSNGQGNGSTKKPTAPPTGSGANNGNGNGKGNGNGNGNAVTPSAKPTSNTRAPSAPGKPSTPGAPGNGRSSTTP